MILRALLDATPAPPADADVDALLHAFLVVLAARQEILDRWIEPIVVTDEVRALAEQLTERDAAWHDALAAAQVAVSQHRVNAGKLRGYASAQAGEL